MSPLSILHFIDEMLQPLGWLPIWLLDMYLDHYHRVRMDRGKYRRWAKRLCARMFGLIGELTGHLMIFLAAALGALCGCLATGSTVPASLFWLFVLVTDVIDFITGSENPPWRRWLASLSKKLVIQPPPRPVIDVGR